MGGGDFQLKGLASRRWNSSIRQRRRAPVRCSSRGAFAVQASNRPPACSAGNSGRIGLATEHLADAHYTAQAALVLAAPTTLGTSDELAEPSGSARSELACGGACRIGGHRRRRPPGGSCSKILADDRHPLAAHAAEAAGLAADPDLLPPLAALMRSRNKRIALASLVAVRQVFQRRPRSSPFGLAAVDRIGPQAVCLKGRPAICSSRPSKFRSRCVRRNR